MEAETGFPSNYDFSHLKRGSGGPFSISTEGEEGEEAGLKGNKKTSASSGNVEECLARNIKQHWTGIPRLAR